MEEFYDADIAPLMAQIIAKCRAGRIPMHATFELDAGDDEEQPLLCTTTLQGEGFDSSSNVIGRLCAVVNGQGPAFRLELRGDAFAAVDVSSPDDGPG